MDVRGLFSVFALVALSACSLNKSVSTVFNEKTGGGSCPYLKVAGQYIVQWEDGRITTERAESDDAFIENFVEPNLQAIKHVEYNKFVLPTPTANGSVESTSTSDWAIDAIKANEVWNQGYKGAGIKVAVTDAPIDFSHPQLAPRVQRNLAEYNGVNGVDDDGNGLVDDKYGWDFYGDKPIPDIEPGDDHGTHVAGIILADHSKGSVKGVAPAASLIPVSFMGADGGTLDDAIAAVKYAAAQGANVINASWGGSTCSQTLQDTIGSLASKNILFVAASGNEGVDFDRDPYHYSYPAVYNFPHQLTVAASNSLGYMTGFSNRSFSLVHIVAPGDGIVSTVPGGGTESMSGTSMATPFVSGAAALIWSAKPSATALEVRSAILGSVYSFQGRTYKVSSGGHLNVSAALSRLLSQ